MDKTTNNNLKGGSPVGEPSTKTEKNITQNNNGEQNNADELTKKIQEILAEQLTEFKELKDSSETLIQEKFKIEVEKLLSDSQILDGRFFDFVNADDIELVKTRIENLENLITEKVNESVDSRIGANAWYPGNNSNSEIDTFKKPSYMI